MRAVRKRGPGRARAGRGPRSTPGPDEVPIRIEAASICGTDLHIERWDEWSSERVKPPLTLGHELCGTVVALGSAVSDVEEGDYVSAESHVTWGLLPLPTGRAHMCERTRILGVDRDGGSRTTSPCPPRSSGATTARSSCPRSRACRSPSGTPCSRRRPRSSCGGRRPRLRPRRALLDRDRARVRGRRLLASDTVPFRLELAKTLGADAVVNVTEVEDVHAWFVGENEGIGMGVVFEMSGALKAIEDAFRIVRHGGNVVLFGIPARPATIDIAESLIFKNLTVSAVNGRRSGDLVHDALAARARRRRPSAADHRRAAARALRGGVRPARHRRGLQDRPATERSRPVNTVLTEVGAEPDGLRDARTQGAS